MQHKCAVPNHELRSKTAPSAGDVSGKTSSKPVGRGSESRRIKEVPQLGSWREVSSEVPDRAVFQDFLGKLGQWLYGLRADGLFFIDSRLIV